MALDYLHNRGMSDETIAKFGIGLAPSYSDALVKTLANNRYSLDVAMKLGLLNEHNGQYYDRFKSRIMFPIFDKIGHVVGFSGRVFFRRGYSFREIRELTWNHLFSKKESLFII